MKKSILTGKKDLLFLLLFLSDIVAFLISTTISYYIFGVEVADLFYSKLMIFSTVILVLAYSSYALYKDKRNLFDGNDFMGILYSSTMAWFVISLFVIIFDPIEYWLILVFLLAICCSIVLSTIGRLIMSEIILAFRKSGHDIKNAIYYGKIDEELITKIKDPVLGYNLIAVTSKVDQLKKHLSHAGVVFMHMESVDDKMLELMIQHDKINWKIVSSLLNLVIDPVTMDEFSDYPIINVSNKDDTKGYQPLKRFFDILASGIAMILLSPLFITFAIIIKLESPGPVLFKHERLGKNLKPFMLYKFRSMRSDAEELKDKLEKQGKNEVKGLFKLKDDPRITKFGKFLRRSSLDELGQLINIFKGDMSVVGPRPHLQRELPAFKGWRMARFKVKPGLTGLWQVNGRHNINFDKAMLYDIYYAKHMSLIMDLSIILKTIPSIIMTRGKY